MVGKLPDARRAAFLGFANDGHKIALVGGFNPSRDGSELAKLHGRAPAGALPEKDVAAIRATHQQVRDGVNSGAFLSAHDIAEGGIAVALAECVISCGLGARIELPEGLDLFGEDFGTAFIVSGTAEDLAGLKIIGEVGGDALEIEGVLDLPISGLTEAHASGLADLLR